MTRVVLLRGIAIAVALALLAWLVADARWRGVGVRLARIDAPALAGVAALFAASYLMRAARIDGEFRDEIGGPDKLRYLRVLRLTLVHNALVNVLPFRSGEAAFPILLARWFGIGSGRAVVSLLWLRAQDATVVAALAAVVWPGLPIGWRCAALVALVGGAWAAPAWARRRGTPGGTPGGALRSARLARLAALFERSTRRGASGWLWTIANWTVKLVAETWLVALALATASTGTAALGAIGAELAAILPVQGVAGFGTFEAGGAALMRTQGVPLQTGLEAVLVLHAVVLALSLAAGALAAALLPGPPRTPPSGSPRSR